MSPEHQVSVSVIDTTPPALSITTPPEGETFTLAANGVTVEVRGTASDTQTGVDLVEWALDGQTQFTPAIPKAANDWSTWSAPIPIATAGNHTITIRAKDKVTPTGNLATSNAACVVAAAFEPKDPEAVFSAAAYLDDLLDFATRRAKTAATGGELISRQLLVDTFLQPFMDLVTRNNRVVANQPVHQVRLCIEVLRRYLANHGRSTPASAEATYRQAAYAALLRHLGTSHEEIRLARVADDATRAALASRLGIGLTQFRPDRLDQLLLQPAQVTEAALKSLFGLEETTLKPLADSVLPEPHLLIWQKEHLRAMWQQQDEAARSVVDTPVPVIDPDLIGEGDLRTPSPGNAAYDLWKARQQHVANQLAAIKANARGAADADRRVRPHRQRHPGTHRGVTGAGRGVPTRQSYRSPNCGRSNSPSSPSSTSCACASSPSLAPCWMRSGTMCTPSWCRCRSSACTPPGGAKSGKRT